MGAPSHEKVRFWRAALLTLCLICIAINSYSLFTDAVEASSALGFQVDMAANPSYVRVTSVDAGGPAEQSGLLPGDLINVRALSPSARYRLLTGVTPYEQIPVTLTRGAETLHLLYRAGGPPVWRWDTWVWCFASFWLLIFAVFIAWQRADSKEARILSALLAINVGASGLLEGSWTTAWPFVDMLCAMLGCAGIAVSVALVANYALLFGRPISRSRFILASLTWLTALAVTADEVVRLAMLWTGTKPWVAQTLGPDWHFQWSAVPYILALACVLAGIVAASGKDRGRIAWSTASLSVLILSEGLQQLVPGIFSESARGAALVASYEFVNVGTVLAPLGMTYALLNRRLLDIGFVLNRVAIFSGVSFVLVGAFVLVEWALGSWLQALSHTASLLVGAAVALVLGLSIHVVHARVEHVLDRVFFRKRHEDEQAIRRFAHEAAYITDAQTLIARTIQVLERHADASFARLSLDDGTGSYGGVSENDPAIVSLRTWHRVLDLHGLETQLQGEFAYPMIARGRLVGVLGIGPKNSEEPYAPDESQAIEDLAHGAAGALDVLVQSRGGPDESIATELHAMQSAIADGFAAINSRLERVAR